MKEDEKFKGTGCLATNPALHQWSDRTFDLASMCQAVLAADLGVVLLIEKVLTYIYIWLQCNR